MIIQQQLHLKKNKDKKKKKEFKQLGLNRIKINQNL